MRKFSSWLLAAAAFAMLPAAVRAQEKTLEQKLDDVFAPWNKSDAPGGVVGVVKDGMLIYARGFGLANMEHGVTMTEESVIDIGSISKQFTAMAILLLEEDGKLSLDDEPQQYIPELPRFEQKMTIRNLLTHTSGLRDYFTLFILAGWDFKGYFSDEQALDLISRQQDLNFEPGKGWNYCNTGYFLLSQIVERVSGKTLEQFSHERIFVPLGMTHTFFDDDNTRVIRNRAYSYRLGPEGAWHSTTSPLEVVGDGALHTTIGDMVKWNANFDNNQLGKKRPALIQRMLETYKIGEADTKYAAGLFIDDLYGVKRVQHGGDWLGYNAQYSRFPEHNVAIFSFGNDGTQLGKSLNVEAAKVVLGEHMKLPEEEAAAPTGEIQLTDAQKEAVVGTWMIQGVAPAKIFVDNDGILRLQAQGQPAFELFARSETFLFLKIVDATLEFKKGEDGKMESGILTQSGMKFPLKRLAEFEPTDEMKQRVAGSYYSPELQAVYRITLVDGKLMMYGPEGGEPAEMNYEAENRLTLGMITMTLQADDSGKVTGALIDAGRVQKLRMQKIQ